MHKTAAVIVGVACLAAAQARSMPASSDLNEADRQGRGDAAEAREALRASAAAKTTPAEAGKAAAADAPSLSAQAFVGEYELVSCPIQEMESRWYTNPRPKGLIVTNPAPDGLRVETLPALFSMPWWFNGGTLRDIYGINGPAKIYKGKGAKCSGELFGLCGKEVSFKDTQVSYTTKDSLIYFHEQTGNFRLFWILRFPKAEDRSVLTYEFQLAPDSDYTRPDRGTVIASCSLKRL